ncbi:LacI family DNA-binding transcriptional regulator [Fodinibius sediminis]|uniref:DNA-binding transcriptional regulator, LacI/PurR family n=1 Tax=Fodinibius sediminis TaxID=1214077 RepID=A0A521CVR4_9BACT|nr:LacI family DNA-binding transcriptional regulator [Fodinibius sediminis]SMO63502.1 DNA-binding transcriptional regulator, LacI/PurR family [Fodinibius sediminis]
MKVTLKDIAEDTGYSISTVSRVLNGFDTNPDTKKTILKSARKLNYPIQNFDKGLNSEELLDILLITGIEVGEFYASFFDGLNKAASRQNVRLSLSSLEDRIPRIEDIAKKIEEEDFDGLIINVPRFSKGHYQELKEVLPEDFPVISNEILDNPIFETVGFDNYGGGQLVARHFKERGYTSCGIIHGPSEKNVSRQRAHGFIDYVSQQDDMKLRWQFEGDFSFESGIRAFDDFNKMDSPPRAVFSGNDNMCQGFMQQAMVEQLSFPDDIAIVGFDDLPICSRHRPKISSIHTNYEHLGTVSIQKMKTLLGNTNHPGRMLNLVPTTLMVRESS